MSTWANDSIARMGVKDLDEVLVEASTAMAGPEPACDCANLQYSGPDHHRSCNYRKWTLDGRDNYTALVGAVVRLAREALGYRGSI